MKRRNTLQRKLIRAELCSRRDHPTAEQIFKKVKRKSSSISLATIYRNLHILEEEGLIKSLSVKGEMHYDGAIEKHMHLVCRYCEKIQDLPLPKWPALKKLLRGFKISDSEIRIGGVCAACAK